MCKPSRKKVAAFHAAHTSKKPSTNASTFWRIRLSPKPRNTMPTWRSKFAHSHSGKIYPLQLCQTVVVSFVQLPLAGLPAPREVFAAYSPQICRKCGNMGTRDEDNREIFRCPSCDVVMDADKTHMKYRAARVVSKIRMGNARRVSCFPSIICIIIFQQSIFLFLIDWRGDYFGNVRLDKRSKLDNWSELWH